MRNDRLLSADLFSFKGCLASLLACETPQLQTNQRSLATYLSAIHLAKRLDTDVFSAYVVMVIMHLYSSTEGKYPVTCC